MAGRNPTPTALKVVNGNPGKRPLNKQEPDPPYLNNLEPPAWLPDDAAAVWNRVVPELRQARMLSTVDIEMLSRGCVAAAEYWMATGVVKLLEQEIRQPGGRTSAKVAELLQMKSVQSMSFKQALVVEREFGMSPASRTRLAIQPQGDLFTDDKQAPGQPSKYF